MSPLPFRDLVRRCRRAGTAIPRRLRRLDRLPVVAAVVAVLSSVSVLVVATTVFPYHSTNHDEAVYLMQATMLLEGHLELYTGELTGAFRPWFFVEDGGRLYPKYAPVPAALYAVSIALFGEPRVTLAAIAAGNTALVYLLGATAFDRRVGAVAAVLFAASPLALVTSSVFLPYAPTTFLNLLFAVAYLRSLRDGSLPAAVVAGVAIGLAFFARPYTAVLFAAPFVLHALYRVGASIRDRGLLSAPPPVRHHGTTAAVGLLFVGVTLAYNLRLTGSPLVFPYEAFAPLDGPGFGRRRMLGHSIDYTPAVALRANGWVLWYFATRWFTAGPVGTTLAAGGLALAARRWRRGDSAIAPARDGSRSSTDAAGSRSSTDATGTHSASATDEPRSAAFERTVGALLGGLFVTVPAGNVLFWGNYNILATPSDPADGLVWEVGPVYHFDLLAPLSLFAAVAVVACWRFVPAVRSRLERRASPRAATVVVVCLVATSALLVGFAAAAAVSAPIERNAAHTDTYETAYAPFEATTFDDALVFVPTPYGDWLHHPFQYLRNDPGFDGPVVYALDRGPGDDFAVLDAYPDRTYYRYAYQGEWTPSPDRRAVPKLERLRVRSGPTLAGETVVGVPDRVAHATVRLETGAGGHNQYTVEDPEESLDVRWSLDPDAARLEAARPDAADPESAVRLDETDTVVVTVTLVQPDGSTLTYRQETAVRTTPDGVEVVWPPERYVCPLVTACGSEGTYLPAEPDAHRDWVRFETRLE